MTDTNLDAVFTGEIPQLYDRYLVPFIFQGYADDLADRAAAHTPTRVLEIAAGTGVVSRSLAARLPEAQIVATDLNQGMIDYAAAQHSSPNLRWQQPDALDLPFDDGKFDVVVCQFGVMFFPDRVRGY